MYYAIRLDQRIHNAKRRHDIAHHIAKHIGLMQWSLERQLERPDKSILVRTNKRPAAEYIARWLRAYGVQVTVLEFVNGTQTTVRTRHASLVIPPRAAGFVAVALGRQPTPTLL
jgi:acetylornithine deacetylase/succinyl-diaminopimelate desuccinylase-like protein